jgi:hypothetical protein
MRTRIGWASALAVLGLALTLAFAGSQGATAVQGQALIAGQENSATAATSVYNAQSAFNGCSPGGGFMAGFVGCGNIGV